ncbi:hypothetical protein GJ496_003631 [Pomphorhynchus laevis]|nr:hypothetical protein GJ496_003631 [Pomphorhynchus laevis]
MEEICNAIAGLKLKKFSEASSIAHICLLLSIRYSDFQSELIKAIERHMPITDGNRSPKQLGNEIRLLTELILSSVFQETEQNQLIHDHPLHRAKSLLFNMLETNSNREPESNKFQHSPMLLNFCRQYGDEVADLMPRYTKNGIKFLLANDKKKWNQMTDQKAYPESLLKLNALRKATSIISDDESRKFKTIFQTYYDQLQITTKMAVQQLEEIKTSNVQHSCTGGQHCIEYQKAETEQTDLVEGLKSTILGFNELLCDEIISIESTMEINENKYIMNHDLVSESDDYQWQSEDDQQLYGHLPDLSMLSATMENTKICHIQSNKSALNNRSSTGTQNLKIAKTSLRSSAKLSCSKNYQSNDKFEIFLSVLYEQNTIQLIDKKYAEFCKSFNSRYNRKRLVQQICKIWLVPNDALTCLARFAASLTRSHPSFGLKVSNNIIRQFKFHLYKKDQMNLTMKLKRVRFIGELTKFKLISKTNALQLIKLMLDNFVHHNIEMCCALIESCGHFLYHIKSSHIQCKTYLEIMLRKMNAYNFNDRYRVLIENAYIMCSPEQYSHRSVVCMDSEEPSTHVFIEHILTNALGKICVLNLAKILTKLDWTNSKMYQFALYCFSSPHIICFNHIIHMANLLKLLSVGFLEDFAMQVVNTVIASMFANGLQKSSTSNRIDNQKLICVARYFAEFHNFALIDCITLKNVLFSLISTYGDNEIEDPPQSLIRIRMICIILESIGIHIKPGSEYHSVCQFTYHFQCYIWKKKSNHYWSNLLPVDVEQSIQDALHKVDKSLIISRSRFEAIQQRALNCLTVDDDNDKDIKDIINNMISLDTLNDSKAGDVSNKSSDEDLAHDQEILDLFEQHVQSQYQSKYIKANTNRGDKNKGFYNLSLSSITSTMHSSSDHESTISSSGDCNINERKFFRLLTKQKNIPKLQQVNIPLSSDVYEKMIEAKRAVSNEREELKRLTLSISEMQLLEE